MTTSKSFAVGNLKLTCKQKGVLQCLKKSLKKINAGVEKLLAKEALTTEELQFLRFYANDLEVQKSRNKSREQLNETFKNLFESLNQ